MTRIRISGTNVFASSYRIPALTPRILASREHDIMTRRLVAKAQVFLSCCSSAIAKVVCKSVFMRFLQILSDKNSTERFSWNGIYLELPAIDCLPFGSNLTGIAECGSQGPKYDYQKFIKSANYGFCFPGKGASSCLHDYYLL